MTITTADPTEEAVRTEIAHNAELDADIRKYTASLDNLKREKNESDNRLMRLYSQRLMHYSQNKAVLPNPQPQTLEEQIQNAAYEYLTRAEICGVRQLQRVMEKQKVVIDNNKPGNVIAHALSKRKEYFHYDKDAEIWSLVSERCDA